MDEKPFYRRPWFYIAGWLAFLLLMYGAQIYRMGGWRANLNGILFNLVCLFPLFFMLWMAFFAQFVLPVKTYRDRQKIFDRLRTHFFGGHGPALFVENGVIKEHSGERLKKGPGVVWLDSASAAVMQLANGSRIAVGPGVHFTEKNEEIIGTIDLHIQIQRIGPKDNENPFAIKQSEQSEEEYRDIEKRRRQTSAWTRDGIEVIPNISVRFRVDTGFPRENEVGSRFGFRTGTSKRDRVNEARDKEAILKAILGEVINPNVADNVTPRHPSWNQIPIWLAVDVWREYASKFTLDELFQPGQLVPKIYQSVPPQTYEEIDQPRQPIQGIDYHHVNNNLGKFVRKLNLKLAEAISKFEETKSQPLDRQPRTQNILINDEPNIKKDSEIKTAFQVINEMVNARLTQAEVDILDDTGVRRNGRIFSLEYNLLQERGLKVLGVTIDNLRLNPEVEDTIVRNLRATWLMKAKESNEQAELRRKTAQTTGEEKAILKYAYFISRSLNQNKPDGMKRTLQTLLLGTRKFIRENLQLRQLMSTELEEIEEMIKWVEEENGP